MDFSASIDAYKDRIIQDVQRLVKIKSVDDTPKPGMPFGEGIAKALDEALKISEELGFSTNNLDGYAGYAEAGQGEEAVGVLVHLDVVPEGLGWQFDPYGAEISDNKIYGRGTSDDKAPAVASLYALKAVIDSGAVLTKRVRIIFGTNEEKGCECIKYYVKKEGHASIGFTPDANFPLIHGEKAIIHGYFHFIDKEEKTSPYLLDISGGSAINMVADECSATIVCDQESGIKEKFNSYLKSNDLTGEYKHYENKIEIKIIGKSSHGSKPDEGVNAISHMTTFIKDINLNFGSEFADLYAKKIGFSTNGEYLGINTKDSFGSLTFCAGNIKTDGNTITVGCDIRSPITLNPQDIINKIKNSLKDTNIKYELHTLKEAIYMEQDCYLVKTLTQCYVDITGDTENKPYTIGGGTYARSMNNILGFGMLFCGSEDTMHKKNEYVEIDKLLLAAKIYAKAIYRLACE